MQDDAAQESQGTIGKRKRSISEAVSLPASKGSKISEVVDGIDREGKVDEEDPTRNGNQLAEKREEPVTSPDETKKGDSKNEKEVQYYPSRSALQIDL